MSLEMAYMQLLSIPRSVQWRHKNQDIYARIRDAIADKWEQTPQEIQDRFETIVNITKLGGE